MFVTIIVFLIVLSVLVLVHEMGHFLVSRRFGARAEEFGLGFPPRLAGFYKSASGKWKTVFGKADTSDAADTVYSLNLIPLGGFVKIKGEDGEGKDDGESFAAKPIWQRAWILSAGVLMNVVLAAVLLSISLMIGAPQSINELQNSQGAIVGEAKVIIVDVLEKSPAEQAGLQAGDEIVSINGHNFKTTEEIQNFVGDKAGQKLDYAISRKGEETHKAISPVVSEESKKAVIGISLDVLASVRYPWYLAIYKGITTTGSYIVLTVMGFYELLVRLFSGHGVSADIAGPVGIAVMTGQVLEIGFTYLLQFAAILSISLAVINFLPFPALDGGRVLFLIIEKIKGRPVKASTEAAIHNIGFLLLIALIILVTFKDVRGLFN